LSSDKVEHWKMRREGQGGAMMLTFYRNNQFTFGQSMSTWCQFYTMSLLIKLWLTLSLKKLYIHTRK